MLPFFYSHSRNEKGRDDKLYFQVTRVASTLYNYKYKFYDNSQSVPQHVQICDPQPPNEAHSHTKVMDYDEACFMHLIRGVVHNFPKAVGV